MEILVDIGIHLAKIVAVFGFVMLVVAYCTLAERKVAGHIQGRYGPNRVGPWGLLQPFADGIKLLFKEDLVPSGANRGVFLIAPMISMTMALIAIAVIPFGKPVEIAGRTITLQIADINVGVLYIFAITSLAVYGIVLGGWSSNSKYSLMGGLRSSAQMISYELSMGLSVIGVIMITGSLTMSGIVEQQAVLWNVFVQPVGFLIFLICIFAESNRLPFDLPEAESELVGGFHTEYSSMGFALYFLGEYAGMITMSAAITTLFFGGWQGLPLVGSLYIPGVIWFILKMFFFLFLFMWVRWTLPRFRYDQLMNLGWKVLLPLSILNLMVTGAVLMFIEGA